MNFSRLSAQPLEFNEEFDNNNNNWTTFENSRGKSVIDSGQLIIVNRSDRGLMNLINHYIDPYGDFLIVTSFTSIDGKSNVGLTWGAVGNTSFLSFRMYTDTTFNVIANKSGRFSEVINRQPLRGVTFEPDKPVVLKVEKRNNKYSFEVNGKVVAISDFIMLFGTEIGFNVEGKTMTSIDYLRIYQNPVKINLASEFSGYQKENLGEKINSIFAENGVIVSPDGLKMYVVRNGHPGNVGQMKKDDIWWSQWDANFGWSKLERFGKPLNNRSSNFVISVAPDGNTLLLANTYKSDGTSGGPGLSMTRKTSSGWEVPKAVKIKNFENKSRYVDFCLSPDQQVLIMAIDDGQTYGGMDLFASFKEDIGWSEPLNLGKDINSFANEFTPFLGADNKTMYFSSFGHPGYGSADLFVSRRMDDSWISWTRPQNLGPDINTKNWDANLSLPARGDYAYITSNEETIGNIDIFRIKLHESLKPDPVILVKGKVLNNSNQEGMEAVINYYDLLDGKFLGEAHSDPMDGSYAIVLPAGESYSFMAQKEGFFSISESIDALAVDEYLEINKDLLLGPLIKGSTMRLNNIFFETGKYDLKPASYYELNRLIDLMTKHVNMTIELAGHTDNEGRLDYNLALSEQRAKEVYNYLLPYFSTDRMRFVGYGESKPVFSNDTEDGRKGNRRVEFTILSFKEQEH